MEAAIREVKNAYMRDYYKKNKEKIRAAQKRYWEKKAKALNNKESVNSG